MRALRAPLISPVTLLSMSVPRTSRSFARTTPGLSMPAALMRAAIGRDGLVIGLALPQGEREITLGQQAAVAAHGIRRDIQGAAGKQRTRVIEQLPDVDHNRAASMARACCPARYPCPGC